MKPSQDIQAEIVKLQEHSRELVRLMRYAQEEAETRLKLYENNKARMKQLFLDKATAERNEDWLTKPKIVWAQHERWFTEGDYRAVSVSAKQIRVGRIDSDGRVTLYQTSGVPVGRPTGNVIDIEKTFPEGFPK